ncbi:uncharacterized protein METZ01_LOCUS353286 [marine metagenome]|uniref:Uncharacterized protein n=1 Tax=marine metagenome TaxID=408172 RepID=A0A382RT36_9ZZZZ
MKQLVVIANWMQGKGFSGKNHIPHRSI